MTSGAFEVPAAGAKRTVVIRGGSPLWEGDGCSVEYEMQLKRSTWAESKQKNVTLAISRRGSCNNDTRMFISTKCLI